MGPFFLAFCRNQSKDNCKRKETNKRSTALDQSFLAPFFLLVLGEGFDLR